MSNTPLNFDFPFGQSQRRSLNGFVFSIIGAGNDGLVKVKIIKYKDQELSEPQRIKFGEPTYAYKNPAQERQIGRETREASIFFFSDWENSMIITPFRSGDKLYKHVEELAKNVITFEKVSRGEETPEITPEKREEIEGQIGRQEQFKREEEEIRKKREEEEIKRSGPRRIKEKGIQEFDTPGIHPYNEYRIPLPLKTSIYSKYSGLILFSLATIIGLAFFHKFGKSADEDLEEYMKIKRAERRLQEKKAEIKLKSLEGKRKEREGRRDQEEAIEDQKDAKKLGELLKRAEKRVVSEPGKKERIMKKAREAIKKEDLPAAKKATKELFKEVQEKRAMDTVIKGEKPRLEIGELKIGAGAGEIGKEGVKQVGEIGKQVITSAGRLGERIVPEIGKVARLPGEIVKETAKVGVKEIGTRMKERGRERRDIRREARAEEREKRREKRRELALAERGKERVPEEERAQRSAPEKAEEKKPSLLEKALTFPPKKKEPEEKRAEEKKPSLLEKVLTFPPKKKEPEEADRRKAEEERALQAEEEKEKEERPEERVKELEKVIEDEVLKLRESRRQRAKELLDLQLQSSPVNFINDKERVRFEGFVNKSISDLKIDSAERDILARNLTRISNMKDKKEARDYVDTLLESRISEKESDNRKAIIESIRNIPDKIDNKNIFEFVSPAAVVLDEYPEELKYIPIFIDRSGKKLLRGTLDIDELKRLDIKYRNPDPFINDINEGKFDDFNKIIRLSPLGGFKKPMEIFDQIYEEKLSDKKKNKNWLKKAHKTRDLWNKKMDVLKRSKEKADILQEKILQSDNPPDSLREYYNSLSDTVNEPPKLDEVPEAEREEITLKEEPPKKKAPETFKEWNFEYDPDEVADLITKAQLSLKLASTRDRDVAGELSKREIPATPKDIATIIDLFKNDSTWDIELSLGMVDKEIERLELQKAQGVDVASELERFRLRRDLLVTAALLRKK